VLMLAGIPVRHGDVLRLVTLLECVDEHDLARQLKSVSDEGGDEGRADGVRARDAPTGVTDATLVLGGVGVLFRDWSLCVQRGRLRTVRASDSQHRGTSRRSRLAPRHLHDRDMLGKRKQGRQDSNLQPPVLETGALPIAPRP
jgi:hypothetical protein